MIAASTPFELVSVYSSTVSPLDVLPITCFLTFLGELASGPIPKTAQTMTPNNTVVVSFRIHMGTGSFLIGCYPTFTAVLTFSGFFAPRTSARAPALSATSCLRPWWSEETASVTFTFFGRFICICKDEATKAAFKDNHKERSCQLLKRFGGEMTEGAREGLGFFRRHARRFQ